MAFLELKDIHKSYYLDKEEFVSRIYNSKQKGHLKRTPKVGNRLWGYFYD